jgi:hypothetical protein
MCLCLYLCVCVCSDSFVTLMYLESGTLARKTRDSYSNKNRMSTILPYIYGDMHYEFVAQKQAVNQQYYINRLQGLH